MLTWLRTKLRSWLGIGQLRQSIDDCRKAWWDEDVKKTGRTERSLTELCARIGSLQERLAETEDAIRIPVTEPKANSIAWMLTKDAVQIRALQLEVAEIKRRLAPVRRVKNKPATKPKKKRA